MPPGCRRVRLITATGAPVSDPARSKLPRQHGGSETGAPVVASRCARCRQKFREPFDFLTVQRFNASNRSHFNPVRLDLVVQRLPPDPKALGSFQLVAASFLEHLDYRV